MEGKVCIQCNEFKPLSAYDVSFAGQNAKMGFTQRENRKHRCKACYASRDRVRTKLKFIDMYGGQCTCCGEVDPRFLTLDHIESDGNEHRKDLACNQIMALAIRDFQPSKYQVLCYNCNCGKSTNGGLCPHKDKSLAEYLAYTEILLANNSIKPTNALAVEEQLKQLLQKIAPGKVDELLTSLKIHNGTLL